jgi:hypothetical protein
MGLGGGVNEHTDFFVEADAVDLVVCGVGKEDLAPGIARGAARTLESFADQLPALARNKPIFPR